MADIISEYEERAARYWPLDVAEVREESGRSLSAALVMEKEGERLIARIPMHSKLITCEPGGQDFTSEEFSGLLERARDSGESLTFMIGGAHGLGTNVRSLSTRALSLSPWILPHELARLVLAEQLYRAGTILRGEPYHKGTKDVP